MVVFLGVRTYLRILDKVFPIDILRYPADEEWIEFSPRVRFRFLFTKTLWIEEILRSWFSPSLARLPIECRERVDHTRI